MSSKRFEPKNFRQSESKAFKAQSALRFQKFRNFVIKHRHIGAFENGEPPIGCSMIIAVQNYTTQGNEGLPKGIRGNANCVAVWKTGNVNDEEDVF